MMDEQLLPGIWGEQIQSLGYGYWVRVHWDARYGGGFGCGGVGTGDGNGAMPFIGVRRGNGEYKNRLNYTLPSWAVEQRIFAAAMQVETII